MSRELLECKQKEQEYLDVISEMSGELHEKEQKILSLYIWIFILAVGCSMTMLLLVFKTPGQ